MEREVGFYWVKFQGDWAIAQYYSPDCVNDFGHFGMCGDDYIRSPQEFDEIDETPIPNKH